jgi:uncharacterized protein
VGHYRRGMSWTRCEASPRVRAYRAVEYVVVFYGLVVLYALVLRGTSPIPPLLLLGAAAVLYLLCSPGFARASLWRTAALRGSARSILALWTVAALAGTIMVAVILPDSLFHLPRTQPMLWALIMVGYPLASVYPQELIFRAFLFQRYAPVFGDGHCMVGASAAAFGFVHIAFGNWIAVVLSAVGGYLFAARYRQTRSLLTVSVEHALYGQLIFTVGLGMYFYHGAVQ